MSLWAGPLLRRVEADRFALWFATSRPVDFSVRVWIRAADQAKLKNWKEVPVRLELKPYSLASRCHVTMLLVSGALGGVTWSEMEVSYLVGCRNDEEMDIALAQRMLHVSLPGEERPCFKSPLRRAEDFELWFSSCRALSTREPDAVLGMLSRLESSRGRKPSLLCLGGDQIYADELDESTLRAVQKVARMLEPTGSDVHDRESLVSSAGFSTSAVRFHLVLFEEWLALYLLGWSSTVATEALEGHPNQRALVSETRAWERVLANVPTYMMADDHEVTDDWNIDPEWINQLSVTGRRIVARGVAAYAFCQSWGNNPWRIAPDRLAKIRTGAGVSASESQVSEGIVAGSGWSVDIPSAIRIVAVDCRTTRRFDATRMWLRQFSLDPFDSEGWAPPSTARTLIASEEELVNVSAAVSATRPDKPLVLILNTPLAAPKIVENVQALSRDAFKSWKYDPESWDAYPASWVVLTERVLRGIDNCIVLAGDVHYSYVADGSIETRDGRKTRFLQVTSSPTKNQSSVLGLVQLLSLLQAIPESLFRAVWLGGRNTASMWTSIIADDTLATRRELQSTSERLKQIPFVKTWTTRDARRGIGNLVRRNAFTAVTVSAGAVGVEFVGAEGNAFNSMAWSFRR